MLLACEVRISLFASFERTSELQNDPASDLEKARASLHLLL
jgi:hypothetical protein